MDGYTYKFYSYPKNLLLEVFGEKIPANYESEEFRVKLNRVLDTLPDRTKRALLLRYEDQMTYKDIGEALGVSHSYASHIVTKGIILLKHPSRIRRLQNGFDDHVKETDESLLAGKGHDKQ